MRKLAHRFGLSDVALSKKCAKHNIPTPGLGYWAKVAAGQKLKKVKLPRVAAGSTESIVLRQAPIDPDGNIPEREQAPLVEVSDKLTEPHEAVAWVKDELSRASTDGYNRLVVGPDWSARVRIRKACVSRVLLLLDAFFKALVARGHRVEAGFRGLNPTAKELVVSAFDSCVRIEVEEKLARRPHELTREERQRQERWPTSNFPKYDYFPDGEIQIRLRGTHYKYVGRKSWSDTRTQRLDDLLGHAVLSVEQAARLGTHESNEAARLEAIHHTQELRRLRGERLEWYRHRLADDLRRMVEDWELAQRIRTFLAEYDRRMPREATSERAARWRQATAQFVEGLDPLNEISELAKELDPSDEELAELIAQEQPEPVR